MKKIIAILLMVCLCATLLPLGVAAAEVSGSGSCGEQATWTLYSDGKMVISGSGETYDYEPEQISENTWRRTQPWFGTGMPSIKSLIVERGITRLGNSMFSDCSNLESVSLPDTLTEIGTDVFSWCSQLKSIRIPDFVNTIEGRAFWNSGLEHVELPAQLETVAWGTFDNCPLQEVTLPPSVRQIEADAFNSCRNLERLEIPASVEFIDSSSFRGAGMVETAAGNPNYISVDGVLFNKDQTVLIHYPANREGSYVIPESVEEVGDYAFYDCRGLCAFRFPSGLKSIGREAFAWLDGVMIPAIPESVTYIGEGAFILCNLCRVTIPPAITVIEPNTFDGEIIHLTFPKTVETIKDHVIDCRLTQSIAIMNPDVQISPEAFTAEYRLQELLDIYFAGTEAQWRAAGGDELVLSENVRIHYQVTDPDTHVRCEIVPAAGDVPAYNKLSCACGYDYGTTTESQFLNFYEAPFGTQLGMWRVPCVAGEVVIPSTVSGRPTIMIGTRAFEGSNISAVRFPNQPFEISSYAFCGCTYLREITLPDMHTIESGVFQDCKNLKEIYLPQDMMYISAHAFAGSGLEDVYYGGCSERQWSEIMIYEDNEPLTTAEIHYREHSWSAGSTDSNGVTTFTCESCGETKSMVTRQDDSGVTITAEPSQAKALSGLTLAAETNTAQTRQSEKQAVASIPEAKAAVAYEIHLENTEGKTVQPSAPVTVTLPMPDGWNTQRVAVYHIDPEEGKTEDMHAAVSSDGKTISFRTTHFSRYAVVSFDETLVPEVNPFRDVAKSDYFYNAVLWAAENGITQGTSATEFSPLATCTRGQVVTFLWRAAGSPKMSGIKNPFQDVKSTDYFYDPVLWAVEKGITQGTSATTFSPGEACTRAQVVTFLWRSAGEPKVGSENPFGDVKSGVYYYAPVLWAVKQGITQGTSKTAFSPGNPCTRGQVVTFLHRNSSK